MEGSERFNVVQMRLFATLPLNECGLPSSLSHTVPSSQHVHECDHTYMYPGFFSLIC